MFDENYSCKSTGCDYDGSPNLHTIYICNQLINDSLKAGDDVIFTIAHMPHLYDQLCLLCDWLNLKLELDNLNLPGYTEVLLLTAYIEIDQRYVVDYIKKTVSQYERENKK